MAMIGIGDAASDEVARIARAAAATTGKILLAVAAGIVFLAPESAKLLAAPVGFIGATKFLQGGTISY